jgi:hypothetical protein
MTQEDLLAFYKSPGLFTALDGFEDEVEGLPCDVTVIARTVQGLVDTGGVDRRLWRVAASRTHSRQATP